MATIQQRKSEDGKISYRVQVRLRGHPPQTATFSRITDARRWAQQIESAIREGRHFKTAESKKHTLKELIERYIKTVIPLKKKNGAKQRAQLLWWQEQLGAYLLSDVTPSLIAQYRDKLLDGITHRGTRRSPATAVRYLAALSHAFTMACKEWGWIENSPMRKVTKPKESRGRVRFLDHAERSRLLEACRASKNSYLYTIVVLGISCGMRQSEIMHLSWPDVDLQKGRIVLHETKNGERRVVPLVGHALELLKEHESKRRVDTFLLFPAQKGQKPQKPINIRGAWEAALQKANIIDFRFHDLRHSCASYLAMNQASLAEIAEVLGHKTLQMVKRYAHLSEAHTSRVVESMNEKIFGGAG
ncbi:MAG: site-specific integrase [Verrucomicrobiota bacterium]|nr:site-specific integrase [Verrucomicrobiota bacterium]